MILSSDLSTVWVTKGQEGLWTNVSTTTLTSTLLWRPPIPFPLPTWPQVTRLVPENKAGSRSFQSASLLSLHRPTAGGTFLCPLVVPPVSSCHHVCPANRQSLLHLAESSKVWSRLFSPGHKKVRVDSLKLLDTASGVMAGRTGGVRGELASLIV